MTTASLLTQQIKQIKCSLTLHSCFLVRWEVNNSHIISHLRLWEGWTVCVCVCTYSNAHLFVCGGGVLGPVSKETERYHALQTVSCNFKCLSKEGSLLNKLLPGQTLSPQAAVKCVLKMRPMIFDIFHCQQIPWKYQKPHVNWLYLPA